MLTLSVRAAGALFTNPANAQDKKIYELIARSKELEKQYQRERDQQKKEALAAQLRQVASDLQSIPLVSKSGQ